MLTSDKFYRSFVLLPCEICVVPFGHRKIAADWNDIPLANIESLVEILTHACALLCIIVDSILNRQADYISSSIRLATNAPMRRKAPLGTVARQPSLRPVRMYNYPVRKKEPYLLVWFFFSNRQLSILPGRFQPSTFDV